LIDFHNSVTARLSTKLLQNDRYIFHHTLDIASLPCETVMFQKSYRPNSKNTLLLKDVVLK